MFSSSSNATTPPDPAGVFAPFEYDLRDGLSIGLLFVTECALLEMLSMQTTVALLKQKGGHALYGQAICYVLLNMLVYTPLIFAFGIGPFISSVPHSLPRRVCTIACAAVIQSIGYYVTHRAMHTPALYWCHKFHHRFNTYIVPVTANAVTATEFFLAYAMPFTVGAWLIRPDRPTVHFLVWAIGFANLLIHTPWLEELSARHLPTWIVTTAFHAEHHRKLSMNYAAPTINVDSLVRRHATLDHALARLFGRAYEDRAKAQ